MSQSSDLTIPIHRRPECLPSSTSLTSDEDNTATDIPDRERIAVDISSPTRNSSSAPNKDHKDSQAQQRNGVQSNDQNVQQDQIQDDTTEERTRKPKISLPRLFKFKPTSLANRRIEQREAMFPGKPVDKDGKEIENENATNIVSHDLYKADEAKRLDFGLYKPHNGDRDDNGKEQKASPFQRKASHEKVIFQLGSDTDSEAEYVISKELSKDITVTNGNSAVESENNLEDDSKPKNECQEIELDTTTRPNSNRSGRSISRGSFTSRSSIILSTPKNKLLARQSLDNTHETGRNIENNNNNNGIIEEQSPELGIQSSDSDTSNNNVSVNANMMGNDNNAIINTNINSSDSSKCITGNVVPGILRKGSDRDLTTSMSGGPRRYRRRSQMSITSEIPVNVPSKQRRAECESRIRDNLDYFRRRVSVQEENNLILDEQGIRPATFRKSLSVDDDRSESGEVVTVVTSQQHPQPPNHQGFKQSSSVGSISPMSLSPTSSSVIFDYGTATFPQGRRSVGSMSSVRWEDIVLAENGVSHSNSSNARDSRVTYKNADGHRGFGNNGHVEMCKGVINNGYQQRDEDVSDGKEIAEDIEEEVQKMQSKRRHGSVTMPLNAMDLTQMEVRLDGIKGQTGNGTKMTDAKDTTVVAALAGVGNVRDGPGNEVVAGDDPPPYVPMKRRQVERVVRTNGGSLKGHDRNVPQKVRRHSSASVESAWSTCSAGSTSSILRQDTLAIFNRKPNSPVRRLSQISMTDFGNNIRKKHMEMTKKEWLQTYSLHIFVLLIFLVTVLSVSLAWYYRNLSIKMLQQTQRVFFDPRTRKLSLTDPTDHLTIEGFLGLDMPRWQLPLHCPLVVGQDPSQRSCEWKNNALLTIDHFGNDRVECYNVTWKSKQPSHVPYDCFHLEGSTWYGPSNNSQGVWPINGNFSYSPSNQRRDNNGVFSYVVDHFWLSSSGVGLRVHGDDPVHVNWNQTVKNSLCILSNYTGSLYDQTSPPMLKYSICNGPNAVETLSFMLDVFPPQTEIAFPPDYAFGGFYWSAKGILGRTDNVTQDDVANLTDKAAGVTSPLAVGDVKIVLDTEWQREEGDLTFDPDLYPNVTDMLATLEDSGSHVILDVSPHVYLSSSNFQKGIFSDMFVHDAGGSVTGLVEYEEGVASVIDVTKENGYDWLTKKLKALMVPNVISSLRLSYSTHPWLPFKPHFGKQGATPNSQRQKVVEVVSELSEAPVIEHTGNTRHVTQLVPVLARIGHDPTQSDRMCIQSVVGTALTLGLMGYPFIMADGLETDTRKGGDIKTSLIPDRELYIRWLQLASFFPSAQLKTAPWQYDPEVVSIASNLSILHMAKVFPVLQTPSLRREVANGMPLIRPVWWQDPSSRDMQKFEIDDEFIVGDSLLVAPVLCKDIRQRDIYIPSGVWEDIRLSKVIIGPNTLTSYPVPLHEIAVFKRRETVM